MSLSYPLGSRIYTQVMLHDCWVDSWHVLMTLGEDVVMFLDELLHSGSHLDDHLGADPCSTLWAVWVQ